MGLNVDVLTSEDRLCPVDRQLLGDIHEFAPVVVSLPRITLCVFIGHDRAGGLKHGLADEIFRCYKDDRMFLTINFTLDGSVELRVCMDEASAIYGH